MCVCVCCIWKASLMAQTVKNLPAIWETYVCPWVGKIPWKEGMATHSSILAWRIPMDRGALVQFSVWLFATPWTTAWRGFPVHHQQNCAHQDPGERSSDPTRDWACEYPGVSSRGMGRQWLAAGSVALNTTVLGTWGHAGISPFEGGLPLPLP